MDYEALLQQVMAGGGPSAEQKKAALAQALAASGFATLAARTGSGWGGAARALGQGGLLGMGAYNQALGGDQNAGLLDKLKAVESIKKMQASDEAQKSSAAFSQQLAGAFGQQPSAGPQASPADRIAQYRRVADMYAQRGDSESAKRFDDIADRMQAEYSTTPQVVMRDGKPSLVQFGKRGEMRAVEGAEPTPDTQVVNLGGTQRVIDKRTTAPGTDLPVTMDPAQRANIDIARTNANIQTRRLDQELMTADRSLGLQSSDAVTKLRKEYNDLPEVKNWSSAKVIIDSVQNSPDTKAGDLDLIYAVGKVLDPASVIREGEMVLVTKAASPAQQIKGYFNQLRGRGQLTPEQRAELRAMMANRFASLERARDAAAEPYYKQAQMYRLPMDQVFPAGAKGGANSGWGISEVR